jgi:hypothetical protein
MQALQLEYSIADVSLTVSKFKKYIIHLLTVSARISIALLTFTFVYDNYRNA